VKQYIDMLNHILENGEVREDRTGIGTIGVFGYQTRYNLQEGFPAVTTKKLLFKSVVSELLWFIEGSTDERRLAEIHYGKPRQELIGKKTIWTANADNQGKNLGHTNNDLIKNLGPVYGKQLRFWGQPNIDQLANLIYDIKSNPYSRRHILNLWNVSDLEQASLPPCHTMSQFYVSKDNKLSCQLYQRSMDAFLGAPYNCASYSLLTHMIAQICDLEVGEFIHTIGDAHIYLNHMDQVKLQISRQPLPLPTLWLNPNIKNIDDFRMENIELDNYHSWPAIKADMAV
jgi:thymidylate synthase